MRDPDGYPSRECLRRVRAWPHNDPLGWFAFIKSVWWMPEWGWSENGLGEQTIFALSTGGWSGNECLIGAMQENWMLWSLTWQSSRRGGHYVFKGGGA